MTSSTYNNGVSETRAYGTDNTLASISFAGASIGNLTYGWDANKNKTSEAIAGTMSNYGFTVPTNGYDSEDRLVGFNRTSGLTQSWNLSAVGDWNSVTTNGTAENRTHGPTHELLTAGGNNVSTDTKGNITLIPAALRPNSNALLLNWDFDNRLSTADVGNNGSIDVTYKYDALGRRVFRDDGTTASVYVQAGQQTIADYTAGTSASSPTYRYVYGSYIDEPVLRYKPSATEALYYHRNQQYSVVAVTNASATIVERYAYSAYGVPTITNASGTVLPVGSVGNRYMYTGREWDSVIAQYHYRARIYDAYLGRFVSRDPIGYEGGAACYYELVSSSPLLHIDPQGLSIGTTCASSTTITSYELVCLYDTVSYFGGPGRRRVSHPLAKGGDPGSICSGNGYAGYEVWETTTTTTTSRTPCMPTLATTCNSNVLPGPGSIRSVVVVGSSLVAYYVGVSLNYPKVTKRRVPYPWPKKKPEPETGPTTGPSGGPPPPGTSPFGWPKCPDGQCLCCDILTGGHGNNGSIDDRTCECKDPAECWDGFPFSVCVDPLRQQPGKMPIEDPNFPKSRY